MNPISLELVSSSKITQLPKHVCASSKGAKVLRNAVIYGGNAAGKSSIVKALSFMVAAVVGGSIPQADSREYCKCGKEHSAEETVFDAQIQIDGIAYDYGFSCILSKMTITSEWLYKLEARPKTIFSREKAAGIEFGDIERSLEDDELLRLKIYKDDFIDRNASSLGSELFLSSMAVGKSFEKASALDAFRSVFQFSANIEVIGPGRPISSTEYYAGDSTLDRVADVLSSFDTGIKSLEKQPIAMDELDRYVPLEVLISLRDVLQANPPKSESDRFVITIRNDDFFLGVERVGPQDPQATILKTVHDGSFLAFDFHDESDGTKRLFDFMDLLFTESRDKVFVVDELNRSFHPMLTQQLVKLFNRVHEDDDCQLIFTTHENDIMSYEYFRRDEIWFVERDLSGISKLYSLDEFAMNGVRSDARLNKRYLEGRYGGVPAFATAKALAALELGGV